jgi:hypothetical protein
MIFETNLILIKVENFNYHLHEDLHEFLHSSQA